MATEGYIFREATLADYQGVMDINKEVYGGLDYLPYTYDKQIQNPRKYCYVAVKGGEIVAFAMKFVVDDGKTIIGQALRRHPESPGIANKLNDWIHSRILQLYPNVTSKLSTTWHVNYWENLLKNNAGGSVKIIARSPRVCLETDSDGLAWAIKQTEADTSLQNHIKDAKTMTREDLGETLLSRDIYDVVPSGRVNVNWEPLMVTSKSNVDYLMKGDAIAIKTMAQNGGISGISFGSFGQCDMGLRLFVDVYCKDIETAKAHIIRNFILAQQRFKTRTFVCLIFLHEYSGALKSELKIFVSEKLKLVPNTVNENDFIMIERTLQNTNVPKSNI